MMGGRLTLWPALPARCTIALDPWAPVSRFGSARAGERASGFRFRAAPRSNRRMPREHRYGQPGSTGDVARCSTERTLPLAEGG